MLARRMRLRDRPRPSGLVRAGRLAAALALALSLSACGGGRPAEDAGARPATPYVGRPAELFDDTIEPAAVGLDFDKGYDPKEDRLLRERALEGDAVVRVRVSTVTAKTNGPEPEFQLGLRTVEKLAGRRPPSPDFTVRLGKESASHGIMKNFDSRLVGRAFVAFVRQFAENGEPTLHFHLAPDTKDVKSAVEGAFTAGPAPAQK